MKPHPVIPKKSPKIVSVSRRTDIPAFYGDWFMRRIQEGFAGYVNPFSGTRHFVSLLPEKIVCLVFWSKNFAPFMDTIRKLHSREYNCYFQCTINAFPEILEPTVVETPMAIETLKEMSRICSPGQINWRYDPIVISEITTPDFHLNNFKSLASQLEGYVTRCYFSFPTFYGKVKRNFARIKNEKGITISDPPVDAKIDLANQLAEIAYQHGITLHSCCGDYLIGERIEKAHCIDGDAIGKLFFDGSCTYKLKPSRAECGCAESTDIGAYDTCPAGCIYCYANVNKEKSRRVHEKHDPRSVFLGHSYEESKRWIEESQIIIKQIL